MKAKDKDRAKFQRRRTFRLTAGEDARIEKQAAVAGISVSEYMRRLFFGGRPIVAKSDEQTIRELRRLGGLLKHNFETVRAAVGVSVPAEMEATLDESGRLLTGLGQMYDSEKAEANIIHETESNHDRQLGGLHSCGQR